MKRFFLFFLVLLMLPVPVSAEEAPTEIHTEAQLLAIADDPAGNYILMEDLDMTGVEWESPDFSGSFDGNGHAILNLTLRQPGETLLDTYDGNAKAYQTAFAGLFATLKDARIKDLQLINVRGVSETDLPCFVGGIAGYMENSTVENCTVTGSLELRAHDRIFGIGSIVGYGSGEITGCEADMTLICVDTDAATKDEQFLGGIYGSGFIQVTDCRVQLDGYISEHGYVHSGGITGMFLYYPLGSGQTGRIRNNHVAGKITFFEDNPNRRAYCDPFIGEIMVFSAFYFDGNTHDFTEDERTDYTKELRPELCENPSYSQTVTEGSCDSFGYTTFSCQGCGYAYTDCYTLPAHTFTNWMTLQEATTDSEGLSESVCDLCGETAQQVLDKLPPPPTETDPPVTEVPTGTIEAPPQEDVSSFPLLPVILSVVILAAAALLLLPHKTKRGKFQRT